MHALRARGLFLVLCMFTAASPALSAPIELVASVDHERAFVGETVTLTLDVEGTQNAEAPDIGRTDGLTARYLGPSTRFSSINGRVTTSVSHRYALRAERSGQFTIGPFQVRAGNDVVRADAITLRIVDRAAADGSPDNRPAGDVQLVLLPDKRQAYVGERIPFAVELKVGDVAVDNLHFPTVEGEGFALDAFTQPSRREELARGRRYRVMRFRSTLTPLRPGDLTVGPVTLGLDLLVSRRRGGAGSVFDQLMGSVERRPVEVRVEPIELAVRPLPDAGRPREFSGAVGQFDFQLEAAPLDVALGDPITVRMHVRGVGNLAGVKPPTVPYDPRLRIYDPQTLDDARGPGQLAVEQVVIPTDPSVSSLPAVSFSFFEPESGTYRTITRGPFPLVVAAAPAAEPPAIVTSTPAGVDPAAESEPLGRDIVYIKDRPGRLRWRSNRLVEQPWLVGVQAAPAVLFLLLAVIARRREADAADPRATRFRRAGRQASRALAAIDHRQPVQSFYDAVTAAMSAYLRDKLGLPPGAVERATVVERLDRLGVSEPVRRDIDRYLALVETARYAPATSGDGDRASVLELARTIVRALERERRLDRRLGLSMALVVVAGLSCSAGTIEAGERERRDPHTIFYEANAAYRKGDYEAAVGEYERLVSAGLESGPLYFNLGNAYFKRDEIGRAILSYERAQILMPRDADLRANLAYARERASVEPASVPLWARALFAPAFRMRSEELVLVWTAAWWGLWIALALRMLVGRGRVGLSRVAWIAALAATFVGASLGYRLSRIEGDGRAVVTAAGKTVVRYEPSSAGADYFTVGEGTLLEVRKARARWVQVERADGLRGWAPADAITRL